MKPIPSIIIYFYDVPEETCMYGVRHNLTPKRPWFCCIGSKTDNNITREYEAINILLILEERISYVSLLNI